MDRKDELLAYILKREGFERPSDYTIPLRDTDEVSPPLSFAQERFWFLDQFEHAHPIYNGCKVVRLIGTLSIGILLECINLIARRHEVVRTTYPAPDGTPSQHLAVDCSIDISITDLEHASESELVSAIERLVRDEWLHPVNLAQELPIRARLLRVAESEHLLVLTLHQIAFDSQSVAIFFRELWTGYKAKLHGKEPELPALPVQYGDFANWQRRRVSDETFQSHREYWLQRLSGTLPLLNLPIDRRRPPVQGFDGARLPILLPETLQLKLKNLSRANGVTLFMTLLAAFKTLLYRYTAQEDLLVGCPVLNRGVPEIENLLGSFVNTLVLRTNYAGSPSFRGALRRVRETCVEAFANQDFPFEKLVEELQPQRDLDRNAIFQVMFSFQNTSVPALDLGELRSEAVEIDGGMTKFDLSVSLTDKEHGIAGHIEYSTDLFDRDTIERMARSFQSLLEAIADDPDQSIATIPIMTESERRQILLQWNDTAADYPKDKCIHKLFEEQVERTPNAIALEYQDKRVTYRELNHKANQLAHYLISMGTGPEKLVGICVERSIEMVVGLLGILKAGGAYVPLDPAYPKERLRFMLEDADISLLVTQENLLDLTRNSILGTQCCHVYLDRDWPSIAQTRSDNPTGIESHNLAYVIYTSGSTGRPKGVQIQHRSVVNCLASIGRAIDLSEHDAWLAVTTISFDIAALELYLPLIRGARIILWSKAESNDSGQLLSRMKVSRVTVMQATPSFWSMLLQNGWENQHNLKILCGGEALSRELADQLLDRGSSVWNLYGPTEATIWSAIHRVETGERSLPIGRPIANTRIYVLDSSRRPVPIGIPGELYIGGDGLARGYLNRAELTAEMFVGSPFSDNANDRLYRTGDRARCLADGKIELLGRVDNQVKIRGRRIEPGEIEVALIRHPAVNETVVVGYEPTPESDNQKYQGEHPKTLVAYIVPVAVAPSVTELHNFLKEKLPDYMIPSWLVFLEALPLTPNGKIDRNALPPPEGDRPRLDQGFVEPRSEIEDLVAQIWREVLKLDKIGIHDNFFELGGHSLLATRLMARLRISFNIDVALRKLFELPTVAALAEHIKNLRQSQFGTSIAPIVRSDRTHALPLSFSQRGLWYLQKVEPNLSAYNIPAVFRIQGDLDRAALERAFNEIIARHEVLRSCVKEVDGELRQEILPTWQLALPVIDLTNLPPEQAEIETARLCNVHAHQPYDLANTPLMRAALVKLTQVNQVLILNFHHIVADGSSLAIFYKELSVFYEALQDNKTVSLSGLPIQYADYAAWQHKWLKSSSFKTQLGYWRRHLANLPEPCTLPTDFDRPTLPTYCGARLSMQLTEELTRSLKTFGRQQSVTIFMTLFATFSLLLSRLSGQEDIVIGSTIAGRNHPETDGLIGFFINVLPLRADISGDPSFVTLLQRIRELCLDAFTNQDVPFDKIVEEIRPWREPGRNPIFDILFNVADTSERRLTLAGCDLTKLTQVDPEAKFDIVLHAPEVGAKIELAVVYNTALFRKGRITLLLEQWSALLDQVASHPELPISRLSLVTDASRAALPDPKEALDERWEGSIHELLAEKARRSPESLAIVDENQSWTYDELNRCANRLAHALIASGIRPKDLIAIYAHRSGSLIVALFGILKASASFLILDPAYPAARTIDYLRIGQPKGWLQLEGSGELPDDVLSCLDSLQLHCRLNVPQWKGEVLHNLSVFADSELTTIVTADDPAYVAFTSGSTGEPKGVLCCHGPITHFLPWQKEAFELNEDDRFAMLSGLAYSHLHRDVFTALGLGATLYIPNPSEARSPEYAINWLERNAVTILHLTPALGQLLLTSSDTRLRSVRRVFFGGDVLTSEMVANIRRLAPNATIGSFYGATETQRAVGYFETENDPTAAQLETLQAVPLGRGIKDVQLLVLNRSRQLAGVGELGEVYVRSPHLAEGYVGDKTLTRERFVTNPFTNDPQDRLYRSGELGRYLPDGNVEWAGRDDRRVNIRGFRVELEEVESVLRQYPAVKDAAIVVCQFEQDHFLNQIAKIKNPKSDRCLVAYVAADEDQIALADLLHEYLSFRLPDYMVPSHYVVVEQLPLNPNGKIDHRALPAVQQFMSPESRLIQAAQNEVEAKICAIFCQVLSREQVGIRENFFRIGGHSLLAAQAMARIREAFGVGFELRTFLESPSVVALAKEVERRLKPADTTPSTEDTDREQIEL